MTRLFAYGTLCKTAWRNAILGAEYPVQPATLRGYRRIAVASGYLSLRETVFDVRRVNGVLIDLDEVGRRIADAWEEVPTYHPIGVVVNTMSGPVEAVAYVGSSDEGAVPVDDDRYALISDAAVEAAIETFGPMMRRLRGDGDATLGDGQ